MRALTFAAPGVAVGRRRVRPARFVQRSLLPVSAACLVANGVREALGALFGTAVDVQLYEPLVPARDAWRRVFEGARGFRARGECGEAMLVLRPDDASALVAAAFGEAPARGRPPSPIEREVLARIAGALGGSLVALTGSQAGATLEAPLDPGRYESYFELAVTRPVVARIGVAASEPPARAAGPLMAPGALAAVPLDLRVRLRAGAMAPLPLAGLRPGACLPIERLAAELRAGDRILWTGTPGVRNGRAALRVEAAP